MKVAILQSNYLPWKGYFHIAKEADVFCFYDEVQYTKNDWRNRNKLCSKNGEFWITIPISSKFTKKKISEVRLEDTRWQKKHFNAISLTYRSAPCFEQLESFLKKNYLERDWEMLSELNQSLIKDISKMLSIKTIFKSSAKYHLEGDKIHKLISLLKQMNASEYISGPSGKNYLSGAENLFTENGIKIRYMDYSNYKPYKQSIDGFKDNVSIIDMIAHIKLSEIGAYIWGCHEG